MSTPLPFTAFVEQVIGVRLKPAQRVLARVAFDGLDPVELEAGERIIARAIFGDVDRIDPEARHVLVAVCGARAGKSFVLCALRLLHLALTVPLTTLARGELAVAIIVAPDLRLARQTLRYALGAAKGCPDIARLIESETSDSFTLRRPESGALVSIECLPATRGGSALRGRSLVGAVLDESAFFRDESYQVNDSELFKAVAPRVLPGGQIVVASTPWAEAGLLFELFRENHGNPTTAIAAHAPTLLLRDEPATRSVVERERQRDPANAAREYDAEFMATDGQAFFDARAIDAAIDAALVLPRPWNRDAVVGVGGDFAFVRDSSAFAVVQRTGYGFGDRYELAELIELIPKAGPLVPSAVVREFSGAASRYGSDTVTADGHYREAVDEHMRTYGLWLKSAPEGALGKAETYTTTRTVLHEGRLKLPPHERLIRQLKDTIGKPTPGGAISIQNPRRPGGGHGDLVSALVLAVHEASKRYVRPPPPPEPEEGTPEWAAKYREERMQAKIDRMRLEPEPWWARNGR